VVSGAHYPSFLSRASLYRLLLPDLLSTRARTIYLDADTVVLSSLQSLWDTELDGHILAAVREASAPWAAGPSGTNWRELGLAPDSPYFNSGLLVLPLDLWRQERLGDKAIEFLRTFRPRWGDQCALNAVAAGRWLEVPRRWNLQTADVEGRGLAWALWREAVEEAVADPAVVHFTERAKPWTPGASHPRADLWFQVLDQTSWAGWRPPPRKPMRDRARGGARRLLRSTRAALSSTLAAAPSTGAPWGGGV
jgi:lipopolysaccharide biosynthesis glycosyltransferase